VTEPVGGWNFAVSLVDAAGAVGTVVSVAMGGRPIQAGFSECAGLETSMAIEEYKEGGRNDTVLRFPGRIQWAPLRLRRGVAVGNDLWAWYQGFLEGRGKRKDGVVTLLNDAGDPVRAWRFLRGLPSKWTGPMLNATQSTVAIEELEIAHEGLRAEGGGAVSQIAGAIGTIARTLGG